MVILVSIAIVLAIIAVLLNALGTGDAPTTTTQKVEEVSGSGIVGITINENGGVEDRGPNTGSGEGA